MYWDSVRCHSPLDPDTLVTGLIVYPSLMGDLSVSIYQFICGSVHGLSLSPSVLVPPLGSSLGDGYRYPAAPAPACPSPV